MAILSRRNTAGIIVWRILRLMKSKHFKLIVYYNIQNEYISFNKQHGFLSGPCHFRMDQQQTTPNLA